MLRSDLPYWIRSRKICQDSFKEHRWCQQEEGVGLQHMSGCWFPMSYEDSESSHFPGYQKCITAVGSVLGAIGTSQQRHLASVGQLWPKNNRNVLKMTAMILACMGVKGDMIQNFLHQTNCNKWQISNQLTFWKKVCVFRCILCETNLACMYVVWGCFGASGPGQLRHMMPRKSWSRSYLCP